MTLNEQTVKRLNEFKKRYGIKRKATVPPEEKARQEAEKTYYELQRLRAQLPAKFNIKEAETILQLSKSNTYRKLRLMEVCGLINLVSKNPLTFINTNGE